MPIPRRIPVAALMSVVDMPNLYTTTINISGTGSDETDYIIPLMVHRGAKTGDTTATDIFLNGLCRTDFSDLRFTDGSDNALSHYIHSYGNYEVIADNTHLGDTNIITAAGKIVASNILGITPGIAESADNGASWTVLYPTTAQILWVDAVTDYYFACIGNTLARSIDAGHLTWTTVIDMAAASGTVLPYAFCEDAAGVLYAGRYQNAKDPVIWRSLDGGATWEVIYDTARGDADKQHVHGLGIDPYTGYLYAGVDGDTRKLIRSTNASNAGVAAAAVTWTELISSDCVQMIFGSGWRMFSEETPMIATVTPVTTVFRTTDDVTFTSEILTGQCGRVLRQVGNSIYLTTSAMYNQRYPQILRRDNVGNWTTIWAQKYDTGTANDGPRWADAQGTPTTGEAQLLIGPQGSYNRLRLYDGGSHYQALVYVKLATLPAAGTTIKILYGAARKHTTSTPSIYSGVTQTGLLAHYKLDENTGTTITDATSGKNGVLTPGAGYWNGMAVRLAGANVPPVGLPGASYHFGGNSKIVITGSDTDPDMQFTKNFTVLAFIKSLNPSTTTQWIIGKGSSAAEHWALITRYGGFYLALERTSPVVYTTASASMVGDGGPHMVAMVVDNSNQVMFSIDGHDYTPTAALNPTIQANNGLLSIGADPAGLLPFTGDIDDVQIYNTALTALQIRQIYEARMVSATSVGIPITAPCVVLDGTATQIDAGNHASIQNLPDGAFTIEGWFNPDTAGQSNLGTLFQKYSAGGWQFLYNSSATQMAATIYCQTTNSTVSLTVTPGTGWHHIAVTFDDAGDRKVRVFLDGAAPAVGSAGVGNYLPDAGATLKIGYSSSANRRWDGSIGWVRISNVVRYTAAFTPVARHTPPALDANTVRLFKSNTGSGTALVDSSTNAQNATITSGAWADV